MKKKIFEKFFQKKKIVPQKKNSLKLFFFAPESHFCLFPFFSSSPNCLHRILMSFRSVSEIYQAANVILVREHAMYKFHLTEQSLGIHAKRYGHRYKYLLDRLWRQNSFSHKKTYYVYGGGNSELYVKIQSRGF